MSQPPAYPGVGTASYQPGYPQQQQQYGSAPQQPAVYPPPGQSQAVYTQQQYVSAPQQAAVYPPSQAVYTQQPAGYQPGSAYPQPGQTQQQYVSAPQQPAVYPPPGQSQAVYTQQPAGYQPGQTQQLYGSGGQSAAAYSSTPYQQPAAGIQQPSGYNPPLVVFGSASQQPQGYAATQTYVTANVRGHWTMESILLDAGMMDTAEMKQFSAAMQENWARAPPEFQPAVAALQGLFDPEYMSPGYYKGWVQDAREFLSNPNAVGWKTQLDNVLGSAYTTARDGNKKLAAETLRDACTTIFANACANATPAQAIQPAAQQANQVYHQTMMGEYGRDTDRGQENAREVVASRDALGWPNTLFRNAVAAVMRDPDLNRAPAPAAAHAYAQQAERYGTTQAPVGTVGTAATQIRFTDSALKARRGRTGAATAATRPPPAATPAGEGGTGSNLLNIGTASRGRAPDMASQRAQMASGAETTTFLFPFGDESNEEKDQLARQKRGLLAKYPTLGFMYDEPGEFRRVYDVALAMNDEVTGQMTPDAKTLREALRDELSGSAGAGAIINVSVYPYPVFLDADVLLAALTGISNDAGNAQDTVQAGPTCRMYQNLYALPDEYFALPDAPAVLGRCIGTCCMQAEDIMNRAVQKRASSKRQDGERKMDRLAWFGRFLNEVALVVKRCKTKMEFVRAEGLWWSFVQEAVKAGISPQGFENKSFRIMMECQNDKWEFANQRMRAEIDVGNLLLQIFTVLGLDNQPTRILRENMISPVDPGQFQQVSVLGGLPRPGVDSTGPSRPNGTTEAVAAYKASLRARQAAGAGGGPQSQVGAPGMGASAAAFSQQGAASQAQYGYGVGPQGSVPAAGYPQPGVGVQVHTTYGSTPGSGPDGQRVGVQTVQLQPGSSQMPVYGGGQPGFAASGAAYGSAGQGAAYGSAPAGYAGPGPVQAGAQTYNTYGGHQGHGPMTAGVQTSSSPMAGPTQAQAYGIAAGLMTGGVRTFNPQVGAGSSPAPVYTGQQGPGEGQPRYVPPHPQQGAAAYATHYPQEGGGVQTQMQAPGYMTEGQGAAGYVAPNTQPGAVGQMQMQAPGYMTGGQGGGGGTGGIIPLTDIDTPEDQDRTESSSDGSPPLEQNMNPQPPIGTEIFGLQVMAAGAAQQVPLNPEGGPAGGGGEGAEGSQANGGGRQKRAAGGQASRRSSARKKGAGAGGGGGDVDDPTGV